jgi:hypothetical protein
MMNARTAEYVSPASITRLRVVEDPSDGMFRVVADYRSERMVPSGVILWEPSLFRLSAENREDVALHHLIRLAAEVSP